MAGPQATSAQFWGGAVKTWLLRNHFLIGAPMGFQDVHLRWNEGSYSSEQSAGRNHIESALSLAGDNGSKLIMCCSLLQKGTGSTFLSTHINAPLCSYLEVLLLESNLHKVNKFHKFGSSYLYMYNLYLQETSST